MWNMLTLTTIGIMIISAGVGSILLRGSRVPHIVVYIFTGLLLGEFERNFYDQELLKASQSSLDIITESGIALLLFLVGMELSISKIKDIGMDALIIGLIQIVACLLLGSGLGFFMGQDWTSSLVIALAMTFSSTVIVVKLLGEKRHLSALYGRMAIGILLVQDLVVILALTIIGSLSGGQAEAYNFNEIALSILKAFAGVALLLGATLGLAQVFVKRLMRWSSSSTESLFVWSLTWCFLVVAGAGALGLSHEIGAFMAGISLAQLSLSNSLKQRVHPLMNFFIGIFFIALGMEINIIQALRNWRSALVFSLFVIFGKSIILLMSMAKRKFPERSSFLLAISMAQISEFSFLFIALAKGNKLVDEQAVAIVALTGIVTFVSSSFLVAKNQSIYRFFTSRSLLSPFQIRPKTSAQEFPKAGMSGHIIVIGMNSLGHEICHRLVAEGKKVLAIDNDPHKLLSVPCESLVGNADYSSILEEANFANSLLVITTLRIEDVNNSLVYRCGKMGIPVAAHGFDSTVVPELKKLGADYVINSKSSWLKRLIKELEKRGEALP